MENIRIVLKNSDGTCAIMEPRPNCIIEEIVSSTVQETYYEDEEVIENIETENGIEQVITVRGVEKVRDKIIEEVIQRFMTLEEIIEKDVPKNVEYRIVDISKIPSDRQFRNAWTDDFDTDTVDVDMNKARDIHMNNIRAARSKKFIELGFPNKLNPELEKTIISEEIRETLQVLRDISQNLDLTIAETPEELSQIWPEELK